MVPVRIHGIVTGRVGKMLRKGLLKVKQLHEKGVIRRDFDAEEWEYAWLKRGDAVVLRLEHSGDPDATDSFDFVEFSPPVSIEFEHE
jgi:hypothetical protein